MRTTEPTSHRLRRSGPRSLPGPIVPWAILVAILLFAGGCGPGEVRAPTSRGYVLISIDTLRADHLGIYGHHRDTSPFFDSLAGRGVLFEHAVAHVPATLPSHMSIFTGLLPAEHGVIAPDAVLPADVPTLPEVFAGHGYRTAGHTEGGYVDGDYGFARGFEEYVAAPDRRTQDARTTFERGVDFLRRLGDDEPFFLFLHTYSVHDPYVPPPEYSRIFWAGETPDVFRPTGENLVRFNRGEGEISREGVEYFAAQYDASIRYVDDVLREFFRHLEDLGLADEVTVVITSDHGEEFLEHGLLTHGQAYPEHLHVPLLFVGPGLAEGRRVDGPVGSVDLPNTLLDLADLPLLPARGRSLGSLVAGLADTGLPGEDPRGDGDRDGILARAFEPPVRALVTQHEGRLHHLLFFRSRAAPVEGADGEVWGGLRYAFDVPARLELEIAAYHRPRELRVEVEARPLADTGEEDVRRDERTLRIMPDRWTPFAIEGPADGEVKRAFLRPDSCDSPYGLGEHPSDDRCLSFRLRGPPLYRLELYDLQADPLAHNDLSRAEGEVAERLLRRLVALTPEDRDAAGRRDLDPELVERLKSLGYLQ